MIKFYLIKIFFLNKFFLFFNLLKNIKNLIRKIFFNKFIKLAQKNFYYIFLIFIKSILTDINISKYKK